MLEYSHDPLFVAASLAIALIAGFSGLSLTRGLSRVPEGMRKLVVSISAVTLGWGIWSMHFVAMLGLQLPVQFYYDPLVTLISAFSAILVTGLALILVHFGTRTRAKIILAGVIVGIGIMVMHYLGMSGMELCRPIYSTGGVIVALLASVALSVGSFLISYSERSRRNILLGTIGFGLAVFSVHFIAMAGTGFSTLNAPAGSGPLMSNEILAFGVTLSAFVLSGVFLLSGATFATRGAGAGASEDEVVPEADAPAPGSAPEPPHKGGMRIPFEANARTHFIEASALAAIRAEGHYTILYAADEKLFCPWSITEAEERLPEGLFLRTHRSYLVNPDHVTSFERKKDNGVCYFEATPSLQKVPVSRSRLQQVRALLGM